MANTNQRLESAGGMGVYNPQAYHDLEIEEYRRRFPAETARYSDEQLFNIVSNTDDDMDDEDWRKTFA